MVNHPLIAAACIILVLGSLPGTAHALPYSPVDTVAVTPIDEAIDDLLQFVDEEDGDEILEELAHFYATPVDLNAASSQQIASIPTITRLQAARFVSARQSADSLLSDSDVQASLQLSDAHFSALRPFISLPGNAEATTADSRAILGNWQVEWMQRVTRRLELSRGYQDEGGERVYLGSPERHYTRLRGTHPNAALNLTLDKASGEPFSWNPERTYYLYPHHAAFLSFHDMGPLASLIVGDFTAGYGEGLTLSPTRMGAHGRDPFAPATGSGSGLRPFGSSMRNQAFRGVAVSARVSEQLSVTGFWSRTQRTATVDTLRNGTYHTLITTGPAASGYYRTATEQARMARLPELTVGGAAEYQGTRWHTGIVAYHTRYGAEIVLPDAPHRALQFQGSRATAVGVFGEWYTEWGKFFGEMTSPPSRSVGAIGGFHTDLSRFASVLTSVRYLPADFDGLHGSSFTASGTRPQNEYGWYTGLRIQPHENWTIDSYVDHQRYPWLRHHFTLPSSGFDGRISVHYEPYRWLAAFAEYRHRSRDERYTTHDSAGREVVATAPRTLHSLRAQVTYQFSPSVRIQLRADARSVAQAQNTADIGVLLYADLRLTPWPWLRLDQRVTFFDADSFDARLFAYESDLLYSFNLPALHGTGQRSYFMATIQPTSSIYFQAKYGETRYEGVESIGSGWNEIKGNRLREIRAQVRIRF